MISLFFPLLLSGILLGIRREADCLFSALARLWFYALAIGYGVNDVGETRLDRRMDFLWSAHTVNSLYGSLLVSVKLFFRLVFLVFTAILSLHSPLKPIVNHIVWVNRKVFLCSL